jgi:hypothetical protein
MIPFCLISGRLNLDQKRINKLFKVTAHICSPYIADFC